MHAVAADRRNQVSTWRCDRIVHLELWDAVEDGLSLAQRREHPDFAKRVVATVAALRDGSLRTVADFHFPSACRSIASVWLCGGDPRIADCARRMGAFAQVYPEPTFAAEHAGRGLLAKHAQAAGTAADKAAEKIEGMVVDLGQTSAKVWSTSHGRRRIERRGRDFAGVLDVVFADERPRALVLAAPCEVFPDSLGPCTYFSALSLADLSSIVPCPTLLANDADLAAASVLDMARPSTEPMLVLTLGYGVGAALVLP